MAALVPRPAVDGERLAEVRELFLNAEPVPAHHVRDTILASWRRSRRLRVDADGVQLPYVREPDLDTPLTRSAMPVLKQLGGNLEGQRVSIILTDATGLVLSRLDSKSDLDRHLERVQLAPGFSYAERFVGTNGIGTALEGGRPMLVFGHEHYAEHLEDLACAGVPIQDPISGKTVGAIDLTCWRKDADPLLITLARTTADQIRQALLVDSNVRQVGLLQEYQRTCRRNLGIVLAVDDDLVMMNNQARQVLDPGDQAALVGLATESLAGRTSGLMEVELPSGVLARISCRAVSAQGRPAGGVVQVKLMETAERPGLETGGVSWPAMTGLIGSGSFWRRACQQARASFDSRTWLALSGESGTGKLALLQAVHARRHPAWRLHVLDADEARSPAERGDWLTSLRTELLGPGGGLVIRHVDRLDAARLTALTEILKSRQAQTGGSVPWVAVTLSQRAPLGELAELLRCFPNSVEVPPLRYHIEDVPELVPYLLGRLVPAGGLTCSAEAMQLLTRCRWPGNVQQLSQVLRTVVQHRRSGVILPSDLPPECRTVSRRVLSPLESMERDAIVQTLVDQGGNKAKAATALGMSRATIYRKLHEYGIVAPYT